VQETPRISLAPEGKTIPFPKGDEILFRLLKVLGPAFEISSHRRDLEKLLWDEFQVSKRPDADGSIPGLEEAYQEVMKYYLKHRKEILELPPKEGEFNPEDMAEADAKALDRFWELEGSPLEKVRKKKETTLDFIRDLDEDVYSEKSKKVILLFGLPDGSTIRELVTKKESQRITSELRKGNSIQLKSHPGHSFSSATFLREIPLSPAYIFGSTFNTWLSSPLSRFSEFAASLRLEKIQALDAKGRFLLAHGANPHWVASVYRDRLIKLYRNHRTKALEQMDFASRVSKLPEIRDIPDELIEGSPRKVSERIYYLLEQPEIPKSLRADFEKARREEAKKNLKKDNNEIVARAYLQQRRHILSHLTSWSERLGGNEAIPKGAEEIDAMDERSLVKLFLRLPELQEFFKEEVFDKFRRDMGSGPDGVKTTNKEIEGFFKRDPGAAAIYRIELFFEKHGEAEKYQEELRTFAKTHSADDPNSQASLLRIYLRNRDEILQGMKPQPEAAPPKAENQESKNIYDPDKVSKFSDGKLISLRDRLPELKGLTEEDVIQARINRFDYSREELLRWKKDYPKGYAIYILFSRIRDFLESQETLPSELEGEIKGLWTHWSHSQMLERIQGEKNDQRDTSLRRQYIKTYLEHRDEFLRHIEAQKNPNEGIPKGEELDAMDESSLANLALKLPELQEFSMEEALDNYPKTVKPGPDGIRKSKQGIKRTFQKQPTMEAQSRISLLTHKYDLTESFGRELGDWAMTNRPGKDAARVFALRLYLKNHAAILKAIEAQNRANEAIPKGEAEIDALEDHALGELLLRLPELQEFSRKEVYGNYRDATYADGGKKLTGKQINRNFKKFPSAEAQARINLLFRKYGSIKEYNKDITVWMATNDPDLLLTSLVTLRIYLKNRDAILKHIRNGPSEEIPKGEAEIDAMDERSLANLIRKLPELQEFSIEELYESILKEIERGPDRDRVQLTMQQFEDMMRGNPQEEALARTTLFYEKHELTGKIKEKINSLGEINFSKKRIFFLRHYLKNRDEILQFKRGQSEVSDLSDQQLLNMVAKFPELGEFSWEDILGKVNEAAKSVGLGPEASKANEVNKGNSYQEFSQKITLTLQKYGQSESIRKKYAEIALNTPHQDIRNLFRELVKLYVQVRPEILRNIEEQSKSTEGKPTDQISGLSDKEIIGLASKFPELAEISKEEVIKRLMKGGNSRKKVFKSIQNMPLLELATKIDLITSHIKGSEPIKAAWRDIRRAEIFTGTPISSQMVRVRAYIKHRDEILRLIEEQKEAGKSPDANAADKVDNLSNQELLKRLSQFPELAEISQGELMEGYELWGTSKKAAKQRIAADPLWAWFNRISILGEKDGIPQHIKEKISAGSPYWSIEAYREILKRKALITYIKNRPEILEHIKRQSTSSSLTKEAQALDTLIDQFKGFPEITELGDMKAYKQYLAGNREIRARAAAELQQQISLLIMGSPKVPRGIKKEFRKTVTSLPTHTLNKRLTTNIALYQKYRERIRPHLDPEALNTNVEDFLTAAEKEMLERVSKFPELARISQAEVLKTFKPTFAGQAEIFIEQFNNNSVTRLWYKILALYKKGYFPKAIRAEFEGIAGAKGDVVVRSLAGFEFYAKNRDKIQRHMKKKKKK